MQPLFAVHGSGNDSQTTKVIEQIVFDMVESRLCLSHGFGFNAECQVLGFGQAVVALRQLLFQHLAILGTDRIEAVLLERDTDTLFKALSIGTQVHKGKLEVNGAVKEIQETAPLIEDGSLIFLLCQLIVDVLKLNGLGVIAVSDTADAIREHSLKGNGLLCSLRNTVVLLCPFHNSFNFSLLLPIQICRHFDVSCLRLLFEKQFVQPPFPVCTDASKRHNSCPSDKGEPWDERI